MVSERFLSFFKDMVNDRLQTKCIANFFRQAGISFWSIFLRLVQFFHEISYFLRIV